MPDRCDICDDINPTGGTEKLFLGPPICWQHIRFCIPCGDTEVENPKTGEILTLKQLFDRAVEQNKSGNA